MDSINLIQDLAIVLLAASFAGALCKRVGLSVIVGYLLAGIVIGPHTPPFSFVLDVQRIETLSQIGLVFLMFGIGLGLSLTKLQKMGASTLLGTGLGAFFVLNLTQLLGSLLGWSSFQSLFVAGMLMVSSSAVIAKIIKDMNLGNQRYAQMALAITVLEDVVAVVMLAVLGSQASAGVGSLLAGMSAFVVLLVMTGLFLVPKLLGRMEAKADPELQTLAVAGVLFLMALLAVKAGYSLALGAFLLGAIVAEMPQRSGVDKAFSGMRDMFSSVFFVSIGMMIDVKLMVQVWPMILGLMLFTVVVRSVSTGLALILIGTPPYEARRAGLALTPLGEFTFVIAQLGVSKAVLPAHFYPVAVGASILTVLIAPLINRHADTVLHLVEKTEPAFVRRIVGVYHQWLAQFAILQASQLWWQLSKKRVLQITLEVLLVTGLLSFSAPLLDLFQHSQTAVRLSPVAVKLTFFILLGLLVLIPLFAIWRNLSVMAMIFAALAETRTRMPSPLVENSFKLLSAFGIIYWLYQAAPVEALSKWALLTIVALLATVLFIFSRRLIYWHSRWHGSISTVFTDSDALEVTHRRLWMQNSVGWDINLQQFSLPEQATCSGKSIAELQIRSRLGCTIVEIERQGYTIVAPEPAMVLYPGDRLLLLGTAEQITALREELNRVKADDQVPDFDAVRLQSVPVPAGPHVGASLAELSIPLHTGVLVVGINRSGVKTINPAGEEQLSEGDELLLLGSPNQISQFEAWLSDNQTPGLHLQTASME
ncbi:cation:proton antiporter [Trichlorobacter sp.]|uniref:cation:proton antiporter n=1 Tax=Trichlorobacter sp. TaxID=2911007 RepID=UPI002A36D172|nr:cation:proton antiporter [Trichlorobacter sp.]MDY0384964.1 cation:proton antiporter [Trichlorobacter sp.]